MKDSRSSYV